MTEPTQDEIASGRASRSPAWRVVETVQYYFALLALPRISTVKNIALAVASIGMLSLLISLGWAIGGGTASAHPWLQMIPLLGLLCFVLGGVINAWLENWEKRLESVGSRDKLPPRARLNATVMRIIELKARNGNTPTVQTPDFEDELTRLTKERDALTDRIALEDRLSELGESLRNCLENTDVQRRQYSSASSTFRRVGIMFLELAFVWLLLGACLLLRPDLIGIDETLAREVRVSVHALILLVSFPVTVLLMMGGIVLRHENKLTQEVRHYTLQKQRVELMSGLLEAAQFAETGEKSHEMVRETFRRIRDQLIVEPDGNGSAAPRGKTTRRTQAAKGEELPVQALIRELNAIRK